MKKSHSATMGSSSPMARKAISRELTPTSTALLRKTTRKERPLSVSVSSPVSQSSPSLRKTSSFTYKGPSQSHRASSKDTLPLSRRVPRKDINGKNRRAVLYVVGVCLICALFVIVRAIPSRSAVPEMKGLDAAVDMDSHLPQELLQDMLRGDVLVLKTPHGDINVRLRRDWSPESPIFFAELIARKACDPCKFYRLNSEGELRGMMRNRRLQSIVQPGKCTEDFDTMGADCQQGDPGCRCDGPSIKTGMVAWSGNGPEFFIYTGRRPGIHYLQENTVIGELDDETSFDVVKKITELPTRQAGLFTLLENAVPFEIQLTQ